MGCPLGPIGLTYGTHGTQSHGGTEAGKHRKDPAALLLESQSFVRTGRNSCLDCKEGRRGRHEPLEFPRIRFMCSAGDFRPRSRPRPHLLGLTPGMGEGVNRWPSGTPALAPTWAPTSSPRRARQRCGAASATHSQLRACHMSPRPPTSFPPHPSPHPSQAPSSPEPPESQPGDTPRCRDRHRQFLVPWRRVTGSMRSRWEVLYVLEEAQNSIEMSVCHTDAI